MRYSKLSLPRKTANNSPRMLPNNDNINIQMNDTTRFSNRNYESFEKYQ